MLGIQMLWNHMNLMQRVLLVMVLFCLEGCAGLNQEYYCGEPDKKHLWSPLVLSEESKRSYLSLIPESSIFFKTPKKHYWYKSGEKVRLCSPSLEIRSGVFDESIEGCFIYEFIFEKNKIKGENELVCTG